LNKLLIFPVLINEIFEISHIIIKAKGKKHFNIEDEPNDKSFKIELARNREYTNYFAIF
jgi:hypothetical protein